MITHIIHQTWKTADIDYWIFVKSQYTIRKVLSDWDYKLWTDADLDTFVQSEYPQYYKHWKAFDRHIKRVDTARYMLLHKFGGLYADLDFILTRNIEEILDPSFDIFFYVSTQALVKGWDFLGNAFMMSRISQQFWIDAIEYMFRLPPSTGVLNHTGPLALGAFYKSLSVKPKAKIFGPEYFDNERCADGVGDKLYGYHIRAATWQRSAL